MRYTANRNVSNRANHKIAGIVIALMLLVGGVALAYFHHRHAVNTAHVSGSAGNNKTYQSVSGTYLFSGTIMLGRAVETYANGNYNQPFSRMNTLGSYNARIGVLECPVTNQNVSYQTQVDDLKFNCKPAWLPYLKKYFPIINVSSNHMYDMGADGFTETVRRLKAAGFQVVGNYNPHAEKDDCKPAVLPVNLQKPSGQKVSGSLPVALCSYNYKELFSPAPGEIESIHKWSRIMPVIALLNGGPEYEHTAGAEQTSNAHKMIDEGADFVIGNGTHWAQNTEVYRGKLIVYSMGNFIFDQVDTDGRLALNVSVHMSLPYNSNVAGWLQIGNKCSRNFGNCPALVQSQKLQVIKPTFSFEPIASYGGYLAITHRANAQQQHYIEQRANWAKTARQLSAQTN